ncbi:hypothetical protein ACFY4K_09000 [Streptomyces leeuwenhoekii]|uniref:hypothetical protein n=1 Tax=Streptomyces leeuwenhoekii TaxID=1437453 RepID=UPI003692C090
MNPYGKTWNEISRFYRFAGNRPPVRGCGRLANIEAASAEAAMTPYPIFMPSWPFIAVHGRAWRSMAEHGRLCHPKCRMPGFNVA